MGESVSNFATRVGLLLFSGALLVAGSVSVGAVDVVDVYRKALQSDPTILGAGFDHQASREIMGQARSGYLPALVFNYDRTQSHQKILDSENVLFEEGTSDFPTSVFSLTLTQPVFRYANYIRIRQARSELAQADAELEQASQELLLRTVENYLFALAAEDQLTYVAAERSAVEKQLELARARERADLGTGSDRLEAEARLASVAADYSEAEVNRHDAYEAVYEMTGELPAALAPLRDQFPLEHPDPADLDHWVEAALEQNWELAVQRKVVEVSQEEVKRQKAGHYRTADLELRGNIRDAGGTVFGGGSEVETRSVMLSVEVPLYLGGSVSSKSREAAYRQEREKGELVRLSRKVKREAQKAYSSIVNAIRRVEALLKEVEAQQQVLKLKRTGYEAALYTNLSVLDAERDLYSAKRDFARARYEYLLNSLRLKAVTGLLNEQDLVSLNQWLVP